MQVRHVMTTVVGGVQKTDSIQKAAEKMKILNIGLLPVFSGDEIVGMISDHDITFRSVARGDDPKKTRVEEIMLAEVISCSEDLDITDAAILMDEKGVKRLLVTDRKGTLVGIVSLRDLVAVIGAEASH